MVRLLLLTLCLVDVSQQTFWEPTTCLLPDCRRYNDPVPPGGLTISDTPQIVMMSFFGTINSHNIQHYSPIFSNLYNPNGCLVRGTFFIDDAGTDYKVVQGLYKSGHEIGLHSTDGQVPNTTTSWIEMINNLCSRLSKYGVDLKDVHGVRAPGMAMGDNEEMIAFGFVCKSNLLYDSSCSNVKYSNKNTLLWPYTFDEMPTATCDIGMAPSKPFPGKWEVMIADLHDLSGGNLPCVVPSGCRNITTKRDAFDLLFNAFADHYNSNRAPFNMIIDPAWAADQEKRAGTIEFLQYIRSAFNNTWVVPIYKGLEWVQHPTPIANLSNFQPWKCV